ncbi:glycosyltransferase [Xylophilus rhododendri]|uniref:Glycosyltransferase n=1 Tax=Xylophilus rhododendri TaxID=2697032 RepID=A0A857JAG5_9BURK|nr:glycosyltransferase family 2 protein [Xylophilus rhododendri]QHI99972.1 glycosyltransferase [Xylophilus rhododendri]
MLFTVVIPLYNKAPYIASTLHSVFAQSFEDFEVLVVDDGSKDDGAAVVEQIQDSRLRLIRQANAGVACARNRGIAEARGEWIAFLDGDDWWHPEYLATQRQSMSLFPAVDVVSTGFVSRKDSKDWTPEPWLLPSQDVPRTLVHDLPAQWLRKLSFFTGSVAVRASRLHAMQPCFPEGETNGEDMDLWFRLGEGGAIVTLPLPLVAYRDAASESLSALHNYKGMPPYLTRMQNRALSGNLDAGLARSAMAFVVQEQVSMARRALMAGRRGPAMKWLWSAGKRSLSNKRWWVTLGMTLFVPAKAVAAWRLYCKRRAYRQITDSLPGAPAQD